MSPNNEINTVQSPVIQQKKSKNVFCIVFGCLGLFILGCAAIFAFIFGGLYFATKDGRNAAHDFFSLIRENNLEAAYNSTHSEFRKSTTIDQFKEYITVNKLDKHTDATFPEISRENGVISLEGYLSFGDEEKGIVVETRKEHDVWKVYGFGLR